MRYSNHWPGFVVMGTYPWNGKNVVTGLSL